MNILGERLKLAREKKELTQIDVRKITGINNKTLSGYENGVSEPDFETAKILADLYEVSFDYLVGRTDNPRGYSLQTDTTTNDQSKKLPEDAQKSIEDFKRYIYEKHGIKPE